MPFAMRHLPQGGYEVVNTESGKKHAKHTTKENAKKQVQLLNAIIYGGFKPTGKPEEKK